jgi:hypothetical protein
LVETPFLLLRGRISAAIESRRAVSHHATGESSLRPSADQVAG